MGSGSSGLSRRTMLKVLGAAPFVRFVPFAAPLVPAAAACKSSGADAAGAGTGTFFTPSETRALDALADVVIPRDPTLPGGSQLGAAAYMERLCTAFDEDPPALFCDGPFSGRHATYEGAAVPNDFARFTPLDRVTEKTWRIKVFGSAAVDGGAINAGVQAPVAGLRDQLKAAVQAAMSVSPAPLETLAPADLATAFGAIDKDVQEIFIDLVTQAAFAAPEYGGNPNLAGWALCHFDGDTAPLGYSPWDDAAGVYRERADAPMTTADPGADPDPIDDGTRDVLQQVVGFAGGKVFF